MICFTSYLVSFYTCKLIVDTTGTDADFCITLKRYFGKPGYYAGIIAPCLMLLAAVIVLFIILSQLSYPILLSIYSWIADADPPIQEEPVFDSFSSAYTALFLYFILVLICSKQNFGIFIRLGSLGSLFVCMFLLGIVGLSAYSYVTTDYRIGTTAQNKNT